MNLNKNSQEMDFDLTDFQLDNNSQDGIYAIMMNCEDRIIPLDSGSKQMMNKNVAYYNKIKPNGAMLRVVSLSGINFDIFSATHEILRNTFGINFN